MAQLTNSLRNSRTTVVAAQAVGAVFLFGLIVAGLIAAAVILRPSIAAPASANAPVLQAPARDDFAFRQAPTLASQDRLRAPPQRGAGRGDNVTRRRLRRSPSADDWCCA